MRLLLLLPNFVLIAISGYNLFGRGVWINESNQLVFTLLHLLVMALCMVFITLIVKSVFKVTYIEVPEISEQEDESYGTLHA